MENKTIIKILNFLEKKENKLSSESNKFRNKHKFIERLESGVPFTKEQLNIKGSLFLNGTQITYLPKGLKVDGNLVLFGTAITSLPDGLKVGDDLDLNWCINISSLPKGLIVGRNLYIKNAQLTKYTDEQLREMVKPGHINRIMR